MNKDDIVKAARDRMAEAVEGDRDNRTDALSDLEFASGEQWDKDVKDAREQAGRPCPTINRMSRFVRQVTGDIRKMNPGIKILASDDEATEETAEIIAGLIRQIEYASHGSSVYEGAAESAAQCGIGNFRILTDYESETSFNQEIKLERIHNPLSVYWDPAAREPTRADADYCFITDQMSKDAFDAAYPGKNAVDVEHDGTTDGLEHWHEAGEVIVAEYLWKEPITKTIGLMPDGRTVENPTAAHNTVKTRKVNTHKVMWAKVSGAEVLEGPKEFPCKYIPVVAVTGEEIHVGTKVVRTSVIRFAKDPQQLYNYYAAAETESVALQPKAPYLVTAKQVQGLESFWNAANDSNRPYLPYNPDEKAPGAPKRETPPIASQAFNSGMMRAEDDMKATTGIYDAAMGASGNEKSGVAIRQRQMESDVSTSIYTDNMGRAIEHAGRVMVDMIPKVYDTPRTLRIIGDDDQENQVAVNQRQLVVTPAMEMGFVPVNDLTTGRYDVKVTVGPNYSTRRQETAESMMQFVQAFPQAATVAGDLIAKAMDFPDADKMADRLKKILPPGVLDAEDMPPEQQQQMAMAQEAEQVAGQVQQRAMEIEMRKANAEATEAEADAEKARFEVMEAQLQVASQDGQLEALVASLVQQQLAQILAGQP